MDQGNFRDYQLSEPIIRSLDSLGYLHPTVVQNKVIPIVLAKQDVVVKSITGSGKTAAFGIPICEKIQWEENRPQALILTPTRELAVQVKEAIANIGRYKRIKATAVYGKESFARQQAELKQKCHVVVGTPGRVLDHLERKSLDLQRLSYLVIDEADEMLNLGFINQIEAIIHKLPKDRITMLFSATMPQEVDSLSRRYLKNPINIEVESEFNQITATQIDHSLFLVREEDKFNLLQDVMMIENPDSCIIFCRTQVRVENIWMNLSRLAYSCDKIHGGMEQTDRFQTMNRFKRGEFQYLVATDVASRGIDIDNITHVIHYDLPLEKESYVHRTGRTGCAGKAGKAISFVTPNEEYFLSAIEEYIGFPIPRRGSPSQEEVANKRKAFEEKMQASPSKKRIKTEQLNKDILKLYFNGGKKKKIRAIDFVGAISKIEGVSAEDIGIITIQDNISYVDILNGKGPLVLNEMQNMTIKGKLLKVHSAKEQ